MHDQEEQIFGADLRSFSRHRDDGVMALICWCLVFVPVNRGWGSAPGVSEEQRATWWCNFPVSPPGAVSVGAAVGTAEG